MIASVAVSCTNLVKCYGRRRALDGFSLDVPTGSILGLVGPNGAGKTTWMMAVAGLVKVDSGSIGLLGPRPFDAREHSGRISLLPQDSEMPLEATPESFLYGLARLQGIPSSDAHETVHSVLESLNLLDRARTAIRALSHGMRRRVMAAQCFLGDPQLMLLDEPMNGLDPEEAVRLRCFIQKRAQDRTIVISSHNLSDLERLCTHVAFVRNGAVQRVCVLKELVQKGLSLEEAYLELNHLKGTNQ